jgi:hypothetical protein
MGGNDPCPIDPLVRFNVDVVQAPRELIDVTRVAIDDSRA